MRGALSWLLGASLAFVATAGAFPVLANFGTAPKASDPIPRTGPSAREPSGPELALNFSEEQLEKLKRSRDQPLKLYLENRGRAGLGRVDLEVRVSSENTAYPKVRRYKTTVKGLAPGGTKAVDMKVDLSPPPPSESLAAMGEGPKGQTDADREILEARARAPGGAVVVETAVLSP